MDGCLFVCAEVLRCSVNTKPASFKYDNPYAKFQIHDTATVHQHHMLRKKLEGVLHDPPEFELVITLPSKVKVEAAVSLPTISNVIAQNSIQCRTPSAPLPRRHWRIAAIWPQDMAPPTPPIPPASGRRHFSLQDRRTCTLPMCLFN